MQKKNETEETNRLFCHVFVIGEVSIGEGPGPPASPGYANAPIEKIKNGVRKFSARFLVFYNKISTVKKIVLFSSRGQGNFRGPKASRPRPRIGGFEAKARTWKSVLEDVLEAEDVLEDSTPDNYSNLPDHLSKFTRKILLICRSKAIQVSA